MSAAVETPHTAYEIVVVGWEAIVEKWRIFTSEIIGHATKDGQYVSRSAYFILDEYLGEISDLRIADVDAYFASNGWTVDAFFDELDRRGVA